jgi:hypothetical protein
VVEGLALVVPKGMATLTRQRMAHLHPTAAKWHLYEFDQREDACAAADIGDRGNLATRLVHAIDEGWRANALRNPSRAFVPFCRNRKSWCSRPRCFHSGGMASNSPRRGLRMIRETSRAARKSLSAWVPEERVLDAENETQFADLVRLAAAVRHKDGPKNHALWRMHPERWLESLVARNIAALDGRLRAEPIYTQHARVRRGGSSDD